jgi:hypothetical protein
MWWNFVARTRDEADEARAAWQSELETGTDPARFGRTGSALPKIPAPSVPWR